MKTRKSQKKHSLVPRIKVFIAASIAVLSLVGWLIYNSYDFRSDEAKGLIYTGLRIGAQNEPCEGLYEFKNMPGICTHGPDPAPKGVDVRKPKDPLSARPGVAHAAASTVKCYGDGKDGARIQGIYAYLEGNPDNYNQYVDAITGYAARLDQVFVDSAAQTGGEAHIRFVHDASCRPIIAKVKLPRTAQKEMFETAVALNNAGFGGTNRKYLVWMDDTTFCGIGSTTSDDVPGPANIANTRVGYARVDRACWGRDESHEVMHTLGGVQFSSPNSDGNNHCRDQQDKLCYTVRKDGLAFNSKPMLNICPNSQQELFDCKDDDYFSTNPAPGSYLDTHWNTAGSIFLSSSYSKTVGNVPPPPPPPKMTDVIGIASTKSGKGYWTVKGNGQVAYYGDAKNYGAMGLSFKPIVDITATPSGGGYWLVDAGGNVTPFGDAAYKGDVGKLALTKPIVALATTKSGSGYWLAAADGGIFSFGDAAFRGSAGATKLKMPMVGMDGKAGASPPNQGYWIVSGNGGVYTFGAAPYRGGTARLTLKQPIISMDSTPSGNGYWFVATDGGVFAFGDAKFYGSLGKSNATVPISGLTSLTNGKGYWLVNRDGKVFAFGDANVY